MRQRFKDRLFPPGIEEYRAEFSRENARALRFLLIAGLVFSAIIFVFQYMIHMEFSVVLRSLEYLLFFMIATGICVSNRNEVFAHGTRSLYLWSSLTFAYSLFLMAGNDPTYPSFLYLFFVLTLPLFIRDALGHILILTGSASVAFLIVGALTRPVAAFRVDVFHLIICIAVSTFLAYRNLHERLSYMLSSATAETEAEHDPLTGIYNRRGGEELIRNYVANGVPGAFMMIDIDDFKYVNDNYGHARGDEVLKRMAACLQAAFRESDVVMRMGGDEFIVYAINMADINHVENKLRDLIRSVHMVITDEEKHEFITVSIGCIINLGSYPNYEALSSAADKLLYSVKGSGKDSFLCSDMDYAGG